MKQIIWVGTVLYLLLTPASITAAEYNGESLDGKTFSASAYSYDTGNYYDVTVEFSGSDAEVYFQNGGHITLTLDDEEIDDPHNISAYEYARSIYWDLDVDGID